ncbi:hypothetical protein EJ08DRAFT_694040 [Tothia fuscella]|uniref:Uncharacterized protein n=1 Tax=Tothia fuscella TaxID=1048955 RepID=A0A9P4NZ47_9PEZI|nr:hypothetical protein EJ08DRAFT_694040 [Tothia fuscella]
MKPLEGRNIFGEAIDVLVLKNNEGAEYANDLKLLFAVAVEDTAAAVDCVLHVWYSAQITKAHIELLDTTVRPLIQEMCDKIIDKTEGQLLAKTWSWGDRTIRIVLGPTSHGAHDLRLTVTLAPERKDHLERHLFTLSPTRRLCFLKFRQDGILLPFSYSRSQYTISNPSFFQRSDAWPLKDLADPLNGWAFKDVMGTFVGALINDVYGKLYFYVKDVFTSFRSRIQTLEDSFNLFLVDARSITEYVSPGSFARIEIGRSVSNICDGLYVGPAPTIAILTSLLQEPAVNSHATIITLLMNAVEEEFRRSGDDYNMEVMKKESTLVSKYLPARPYFDKNDPYFLMFAFAKPLVRDVERYLGKYMKREQASLIMQVAGARVKLRNTIMDKWPCCLKLRPEQPGAQEEFNAALASTLNETEVYHEWQRVEVTT